MPALIALVMEPHGIPWAAHARARDLAREHGARLHLICHARRGETPPDDATVIASPRDLGTALQGAALVVVPGPAPGGPHWGAPGLVPALLRQAQVPVLFARTSFAGSYRHVLAAVDFAPASRELVRIAAGLAPRAQLELFHACIGVAPASGAEAVPRPHPGEQHAAACAAHAGGRRIRYSDSFDSRRNRVLAALGRGDLARHTANQQERSGADLVVIGNQRPPGLKEFVLGLPARRLLAAVEADVLVVPLARHAHAQEAGAPRAATPSGAALLLPQYWGRQTADGRPGRGAC